MLLASFLIYTSLSLWSWTAHDELTRNSIQQPNLFQYHLQHLEDLSSVDYYACCGLGHRLIRMSLAAYVAKQRNFALRAFWGWCGEEQPIEVFSYLFLPQRQTELAHVKSRNLLLPFYNEISGFPALERKVTTYISAECACRQDKIDSDLDLYKGLRKRYRHKDVVDSFRKRHFEDSTVIGIHVRAGNGEKGDFAKKNRNIENPEAWVKHVVDVMLEEFSSYQRSSNHTLKVYIATDTPSMIAIFRTSLRPHNIPVLDLPQERRKEGDGVLFGEAAKVHNKGNTTDDDYSSCLRGWTDTLTDMFLLSHSNIVIAAKPSSFSQTAPMSLAFDSSRKKIATPYCEVIPQFTMSNKTNGELIEMKPKLQCYKTYLDWCCNYSTWIRFKKKGPRGHTKITSKEFVRFPALEGKKNYPGLRNRTTNCQLPGRGRAAGGLKDKCLPYAWPFKQ
jgi:hypothetical protein